MENIFDFFILIKAIFTPIFPYIVGYFIGAYGSYLVIYSEHKNGNCPLKI